MADYKDWVANGGSKLDWAMPFQRTGGFPLDRTDLFSSLDDAKKYAAGGEDSRGLSGSSYVGQIITVWENSEVKAYQIQEDRSLKELGSGGSITHSWDDTTLTITSSSGTSSADLKGEKGDTGEQGPMGPKGDLYITDADIIGAQGEEGAKVLYITGAKVTEVIN